MGMIDGVKHPKIIPDEELMPVKNACDFFLK